MYEKNTGTTEVTKYYHTAEGRRIAMRSAGTLYYLANDHLGGTAVVMDASGALVSRNRYHAYGMGWAQEGAPPTDKLYTGQRRYGEKSGMYYYGARFYGADVGRFTQADTYMPGTPAPPDLNRYAYVYNSPVMYSDPSGHFVGGAIGWDPGRWGVGLEFDFGKLPPPPPPGPRSYGSTCVSVTYWLHGYGKPSPAFEDSLAYLEVKEQCYYYEESRVTRVGGGTFSYGRGLAGIFGGWIVQDRPTFGFGADFYLSWVEAYFWSPIAGHTTMRLNFYLYWWSGDVAVAYEATSSLHEPPFKTITTHQRRYFCWFSVCERTSGPVRPDYVIPR